MANYEFWLTNEMGTPLEPLSRILSFSCTRVVNNVGSFRMRLPADYDETKIKLDRMIQVWRAPTGGRLSLYRTYFIRNWTYGTYASQRYLDIGGPDFNDLLDRRIVAYAAGETQSDKTDYADSMMVEIVDENMGVAAPVERQMRRWSSGVAGDAGPTLIKAFSRRKVLAVLQEIGQAAKEAGDEVFFDVEEILGATNISPRFATHLNQPRQDLTGHGVLFSEEFGNLVDPTLEFDYTAEENYIYGAGQGVDDLRTTSEQYDTERMEQAPWNRREGFADARQCETVNGVREEARARLDEGRPIIRFNARIMDTERARYGRSWFWGDKVRATYREFDFSCIVRSVILELDNEGRERIDARLDYEALT